MNQALKETVLSAYLYVDRAIDEATALGEAAHMAGNTQAQHKLERTAYALMQAKNKLIEAMIETEDAR